MNPYGTRAPPKERFVAAVITPASPQYVAGGGGRAHPAPRTPQSATPIRTSYSLPVTSDLKHLNLKP